MDLIFVWIALHAGIQQKVNVFIIFIEREYTEYTAEAYVALLLSFSYLYYKMSLWIYIYVWDHISP